MTAENLAYPLPMALYLAWSVDKPQPRLAIDLSGGCYVDNIGPP